MIIMVFKKHTMIIFQKTMHDIFMIWFQIIFPVFSSRVNMENGLVFSAVVNTTL